MYALEYDSWKHFRLGVILSKFWGHPRVSSFWRLCSSRAPARSKNEVYVMVERWRENRKSKRSTSTGGARNHVLWFRPARSCYLLALIASTALGAHRITEAGACAVRFFDRPHPPRTAVRPLTPRAARDRRSTADSVHSIFHVLVGTRRSLLTSDWNDFVHFAG